MSFILICDPTDLDDNFCEEAKFIQHHFLEKFSDVLLSDSTDPDTYQVIAADIKISMNELCPKISLIRFSGVRKTMITKLIKEEELLTRYVPIITGYISEIIVGDFEMYFWDLVGYIRINFFGNKIFLKRFSGRKWVLGPKKIP